MVVSCRRRRLFLREVRSDLFWQASVMPLIALVSYLLPSRASISKPTSSAYLPSASPSAASTQSQLAPSHHLLSPI
jgi:hypothetical protein